MERLLISLFVGLFLLTGKTLALSKNANPPSRNYYIEAGTGVNWYHLRQNTMLVSHDDGWPDDRNLVDRTKDKALLLIGAGFQWTSERIWFSNQSIGLEFSHGFPTSVEGTVEQFSLPEFRNYRFHYRVYRNTLLLNGKTSIYRWRCLMPYIEAALGTTWNTSGTYIESALPGISPRINPGFTDKTNNNFSYAAGAGLDFAVKNNLWAILGYRYEWFGRVDTGRGMDTFNGNDLKNKLYANTMLFRLRYAVV